MPPEEAADWCALLDNTTFMITGSPAVQEQLGVRLEAQKGVGRDSCDPLR
jgi:hypothetical protein